MKTFLQLIVAILDLLWTLVLLCVIPFRWLLILIIGVNLIDLLFVHKWFLVWMLVSEVFIYLAVT